MMPISAIIPRFGKIVYQVEEASPRPQPYQHLSQAEFRDLLTTSGLDHELQGAADSATRLPDIYQPTAFTVVARDQPEGEDKPGKAVGVAGFVRLGEYDYLSTLAVDKDYQQQGIGQTLVKQGVLHSREKYKSDTDEGYASLATMTAAGDFNEDVIPNQAAKKYGFMALPNGAVLTRRNQKVMDYLA